MEGRHSGLLKERGERERERASGREVSYQCVSMLSGHPTVSFPPSLAKLLQDSVARSSSLAPTCGTVYLCMCVFVCVHLLGSGANT